MLKEDIKKLSQTSFNPQASNGLLTGQTTRQTIKESEITNLSLYKRIMSNEEREMVNSILDSMRTKEQGIEKGVALTKRMDSLVPRSDEVAFRDAA